MTSNIAGITLSPVVRGASSKNEAPTRANKTLQIPKAAQTTTFSIGKTKVHITNASMTDIKSDAYLVPLWETNPGRRGLAAKVSQAGASNLLSYFDQEHELEDLDLIESGGGNADYLLNATMLSAVDREFPSGGKEAESYVFPLVLKKAKGAGLKTIVFPVTKLNTIKEFAEALKSAIEQAKMPEGTEIAVSAYGDDDAFGICSDVFTHA